MHNNQDLPSFVQCLFKSVSFPLYFVVTCIVKAIYIFLTSEIVSIVSYSHHYFSKSVTLLVNIVFHAATDLCIFLWVFCRYTFLKFWWNKKNIDSPHPSLFIMIWPTQGQEAFLLSTFCTGCDYFLVRLPFPIQLSYILAVQLCLFFLDTCEWTGACMHVCVCMWRSEDNSRCHFLGTFHSLIWDRFSYWPVTLSSKLDWMGSLAENASIRHHAWVFTIVLRLWTQVFTHVRQALYWQCPWNLQV